jgi:hypothetical protein
MSDTKKHQRMYQERQGQEFKKDFDSRRYGNRRRELARLKRKEIRRERYAENRLLSDDDTSTRPIKKSRYPWA